MEKNHKPEKIEPAETTFSLSSDEAIEAVRQWLKSKGENVPSGQGVIKMTMKNCTSYADRDWFVLRITHGEEKVKVHES